jgi:1-acyl-sn-glycerol-3-phosphate acyltransferase
MSISITSPIYLAAKVLAWTAFHTWFRLRTVGVETAPCRGPLLVASNHTSGLDPIIIGLALRQRVYFLARQTLLRGFGGWIMRLGGAHPIRRDSADRAAIGLALDFLAKGKTVVMFPEGTRSRDGKVQPVRPGIGMIACRADCPILPVYIAGAAGILPRGKHFPRPGPLSFYTGPVLRPGAVRRSREEGARVAARPGARRGPGSVKAPCRGPRRSHRCPSPPRDPGGAHALTFTRRWGKL